MSPTPVQSQTIPVALMGKDICACAATGTGELVYLIQTEHCIHLEMIFHATVQVQVLQTSAMYVVRIIVFCVPQAKQQPTCYQCWRDCCIVRGAADSRGSWCSFQLESLLFKYVSHTPHTWAVPGIHKGIGVSIFYVDLIIVSLFLCRFIRWQKVWQNSPKWSSV